VSAYKAALLAAICAEADRRQQAVSSVQPYDPDLDLYDLQRLRVSNPSRWQAWPAGRRSGKTNAAEKLLVKVATAQERVQVYYVSTSIKRAVATVWDELVELNRSRRLGGIPNYSVHTLTFANGSKVVVTGVESKAMANDLRGRPRIALWFIDECQDWPEELLRYFYDNVVYPSLADVKGRVVLAGTGGKPRGFWYEVATGEVANDNPGVSAGLEFSRFDAWTPLQNPHLPEGEAKGLIAKACRERGGDENLPSIQREFFARFVEDSALQIFPYDAKKNGFDRGVWDEAARRWTGLPAGKWSYIIGADFGSVDAAAWVVWAYSETDPHVYLVDMDEQPCLGSTAQAALVQCAVERYGHALMGTFGDPGGGGKGIMIDLRQIHGVMAQVADKMGKPAACVTLRDALRTGKAKIATALGEFLTKLAIPEWDPTAIGDVIRGHFPDPVDAALYGFRQVARLHRYKPPKPPLTGHEAEIEKALERQKRQGAYLKKIGA
jgi:hypothetical protein